MSDWRWEPISRKEMTGSTSVIKKLPEEWVWETVKLGPSHTSYGRGIVGQVLTEGVYDCAFCRGKGQRPKGSNCPVCNGKGKIEIQSPVVICAFCRGRGEEKPRSLITCTACKGKGVIPVSEPIETCPHCNGRGRESTNKLYCRFCRGSGVVTSPARTEKRTRDYRSAAYTDLEESDEYSTRAGFPSGSERKALEIILERGRAGHCTVGRKMSVNPAYAEMVCNDLMKKGLAKMGEGRIYYPTAKGKKALNYQDKGLCS